MTKSTGKPTALKPPGTTFDFDPFKAVDRILAQDGTPSVLKVLSDGFCAWLLCPKNRQFINGYLALKSGLLIHNARVVERQKLEPELKRASGLVAELSVRISKEVEPVFTEFFHPLGGLRGLAYADPPSRYKESFSKFGKKAKVTAEIVGLMHFHHVYRNTSSIPMLRPSVNLACKMYTSIRSRHVDRSSALRTYWSAVNLSALWIYAASATTNKGRTFLEFVTSGNTQLGRGGLPPIAGRAIFIRDLLFSDHKQKSAAIGFKLKSQIEPIPFDPPPLSGDEIGCLEQLLMRGGR